MDIQSIGRAARNAYPIILYYTQQYQWYHPRSLAWFHMYFNTTLKI